MARLHIYPHNEPQTDLHILADARALRDLAHALLKAAQSPLGFERVKLHTSDGHEYTAMITAAVSEEEWQAMPPAHEQLQVPPIQSLQDYHSLRKELELSRQQQ